MLTVQYSHPLRNNPNLLKFNYLLYSIYSIYIFAYLHCEQNKALCNILNFVLSLFQYVYKPLLIGTVMILQHRCSNLLSVQCTVNSKQ
jgi:hypothetical protein